MAAVTRPAVPLSVARNSPVRKSEVRKRESVCVCVRGNLLPSRLTHSGGKERLVSIEALGS